MPGATGWYNRETMIGPAVLVGALALPGGVILKAPQAQAHPGEGQAQVVTEPPPSAAAEVARLRAELAKAPANAAELHAAVAAALVRQAMEQGVPPARQRALLGEARQSVLSATLLNPDSVPALQAEVNVVKAFLSLETDPAVIASLRRQAIALDERAKRLIGEDIEGTELIRLEQPAFPAAPAAARPAAGARARLILQSTRSEPPGTLAFWPILGDQRGLIPKYDVAAAMGVKRPTNLPEGTPLFFRGERLTRAIQQTDRLLLIYGIREKRLLVSYDPATHKAEWALDFESYGRSPADDVAEERGTFQDVTWAAQVDNILYVSHAHRTYARYSGGRTAYLTAIDVPSRRILWRSAPLVANAHNFLVEGDSIVTGYGFTAESDSVFVLNRKTGTIVQKIPVKSSPIAIVRRDNGIEVHTYDRTVYLFTLQR